jgi:hypothetical protein
MDESQLNFARTLQAVDTASANSSTDVRFPQFTRFPVELRIAIWELFLPDPAAEPPAIFSQHPGLRGGNGILEEPSGKVPIRMTTTCAALLHINRESRRLVLSWAEHHTYELCYRVSCRNGEEYFEPMYDNQKSLPVQGPIFVRGWDPCKDILLVFGRFILDDPPVGWNKSYVNGEKLRNVQHIAFGKALMRNYIGSRWFYQLLAAIPELRSVSLNQSCWMEQDDEPCFARFIEAKDIGCDWGRMKCGSDTASFRPYHPFRAYARWEAIECDIDDLMHQQYAFTDQLMKGYLDPNCWPPENEKPATAGEVALESGDNAPGPLEKLPPWIWDCEKKDFAFETRDFQMVERRGYDDVSDGLVAKCVDLYGW